MDSIKCSTYSIIAYDLKEKCWGVGVASKFLAVGAFVPYAKTNIGAIAIQSSVNASLGIEGLSLLNQGLSSKDTLYKLLEKDSNPQDRQIGVIDRNGIPANYTGENCSGWAGGILGRNYTIQGNMLDGLSTLNSMAAAFENATGKLEEKIYSGLIAGERSGGDKRGKQSAAILVVKEEGCYDGPGGHYLDLRVDNSTNPLKDLKELLILHNIYLGVSRPEERIYFNKELIIDFQNFLHKNDYYSGKIDGMWSKDFQDSLFTFIDVENLEHRLNLSARYIDKPALDYILNEFLRK